MAHTENMATSTESVRILEGGRIVIPARFRKELGLKQGDSVTLELDDGVLRILTVRERLRRARELLAPFLTGGSVVDEFIAERREEARKEADELARGL